MLIAGASARARAQDPVADVGAARVRLDIGVWRPVTSISGAGERNGIQGTQIDFTSEFGVPDRTFLQFGVRARPTRQQLISFRLVPVRYEMTAALNHDVLFAGTMFRAGVPITTTVSWNAFGVAYQYDMVARPRFRFGILGEIERTNVVLELANPTVHEITNSSVATLPLIGLATRFAIGAKSSAAIVVKGLGIPDKPNEEYGGHYLEAEASWHWPITTHAGLEVAYRFLDIRHLGQEDSGRLRLKGPTVALTLR